VVQAVTVTESQTEAQVTLAGAAGAAKPQTMMLSNPPRVVVDLPGAWTFTGQEQANPAGFVRRVRVGKHTDMLRVVLDLAQPPVSPSARPTVEKTPTGLVVRIPK
jgi:hypothetical protein